MPIHPFLIALYPLVSILSSNIHVLKISEITRSLVIAEGLALISMGVFWLMFRNWRKAAIAASLSLVLFFSYGHVYNLIKGEQVFGLIVGRHRYLLAGFAAIMAAGIYILHARINDPERPNRFLNLVAAVLLVFPVINIVSFELRVTDSTQQSTSIETNQAQAANDPDAALPDIYYIILDGYARSDILLDRYGYDNHEFIDFLKSHGFYVAGESRSNYLYTALSIGSTLNMDYIQDLDFDLEKVTYPQFLVDPIHHSRVRQTVEQLGYVTVTTPTGYEATDIMDSDYLLTPDMDTMAVLLEGGVLTRFEEIVLTTSAFRFTLDLQSSQDANWFAEQLAYPYHVHRLNVLSALNNLETIPLISKRKFVFVHIISPHRPYIFGPNGEELNPEGVFTFKDIDDIPQGERSNAYLAQLTYITNRIESAILTILARSEEPPVIILQSDHGPGFGIDWENPEYPNLADRSAILNAYYLPDDCQDSLYPSITPVNSFRVIFNCYLEDDFKLLEDVTYFNNIRYSALSEPWIFTPIEEYR